jgi:hypothetical protein
MGGLVKQGFLWWEPEENEAMLRQMKMLSTQFEVIEDDSRYDNSEKPSNPIQQTPSIEIEKKKIFIKPHGKNIRVGTNQLNNGSLDYSPLFKSGEICNLLHIEMSILDALEILEHLKVLKKELSDQALNRIRNHSRLIMGPMKKPNDVPSDLRKVLIDIALI